MKVFDSIKVNKPKLNKFDLSHERKLTLDMGTLYPILCEEVLPGEKWRVKSDVFLRFLALIAPVMHRVDVTVHYFFVPNRLLWRNFEDFITGGRDGLAAPVHPRFKIGDLSLPAIRNGSLLDHLGFPTTTSAGGVNGFYVNHTFNALPLRAYQLVYDQYYRDQNVESSIVSSVSDFTGDGTIPLADIATMVSLRTRAWEKDYLTSALPFSQRGNPVSIPITSTVTYKGQSEIRATAGGGLLNAGAVNSSAGGLMLGGASQVSAYVDNIASISSANFTVNALRVSLHLQMWLEKNARSGGRYTEQLAQHFGVISKDARLQRAQYLGGGKQPVVISEVLQTAPPNAGSPGLATMGGHGMSVGSTNQFAHYFDEHGLVLGLLSVIPRTQYQNGYKKMWTRVTNTDYYFPEFAGLGEQPIYGGETYYNVSDGGAPAQAAFTAVFGYQSRYAEYKYIQSWTSGDMRENLAYWHFGRVFSAPPALNTAFVQCAPRTDPFATTNVNKLVCQVFHNISALRPIPYHSTPRL